jgi:hypothetical protein
MSVARFIADQRTSYRVPHTLTCLLLGVSLAWFYKWRNRPLTPRQRRRANSTPPSRPCSRTRRVARIASIACRSARRRLAGE